MEVGDEYWCESGPWIKVDGLAGKTVIGWRKELAQNEYSANFKCRRPLKLGKPRKTKHNTLRDAIALVRDTAAGCSKVSPVAFARFNNVLLIIEQLHP
jgi:hypothetical protein